MGDILNELNAINEKTEKVIATVAADLFGELQTHSEKLNRESGTPVKTGQLLGAWTLTKISDGWEISNNMEYASIIFEGRKITNGKTTGSTQLPKGLQPILDRYDRRLEIELKGI